LLNGFDALAANLAKVRALGKEPSEHPNTIFYGAFILGGVGPGKVGIGLQFLDASQTLCRYQRSAF
jgi:hypothetical protein